MFKTEESFHVHQMREFINTDIPGVWRIQTSGCLLRYMLPICLFFCSTHSFAKPASLHSTRTEPRLVSQAPLPLRHPALRPHPTGGEGNAICVLGCYQQEPHSSSEDRKVNWFVWAVPKWLGTLDFPNDLDEIMQFPGLCGILKPLAIKVLYAKYPFDT